MGNPQLRTPFGQVELRPVAAPDGTAVGTQTFVLLPELDELLGAPGFGLRDPILVRGRQRQLPGWNLLQRGLASLSFH